MSIEALPDDVKARRETIRLGLRDALAREIDMTSRKTALRVAGGGALGLFTAVVVSGLFSRDGFLASPVHLAICSAAWSSLVVVLFVLVVLRIRTPRLPLAESALLALVGLSLAAVLGVACPHPQILMEWMHTPVGVWATSALGLEMSSLCTSLCLASTAGAGAAAVVTSRTGQSVGIVLPAVFLFLVIWPSVILQSRHESTAMLASWSVGLALGAYLGVASGALVRRALSRAHPAGA
jgi:hypothetical protein